MKYLYPIKATHCSVVRKVLAAMDTDWRECMNVDRHLQFMTKKASISYFCSNAMFGLYTLAGGLYILGEITIANVHLAEDNNDTSRPFPVKMLLPFKVDQSPFYELLVVSLCVQGMLNVYTVIIVNALLFAVVRLAKFCDRMNSNPKISTP